MNLQFFKTDYARSYETNNVKDEIQNGANNKSSVEKKSNMFYSALPIHFELARELRNHPTDAETFLWNHLSYIKGIRFKRQHPILYFIADFYCHRAKLIIEVDGKYHEILEQYNYDQTRDKELEDFGLKVIRFKNERVFNNIENVLQVIETEIKDRLK